MPRNQYQSIWTFPLERLRPNGSSLLLLLLLFVILLLNVRQHYEPKSVLEIENAVGFSRTNTQGAQAGDRIPAEGRLVRDEGIPLERLQLAALGFPPTFPKGVCDKAAGIAE